MKEAIPWVEKYRPNHFDEIILDDLTKHMLENIVKEKKFPNILFYGPPGTGKTTTIVNLINYFQSYHNQQNNSLIIHQNASDERGVDVIRNHLFNFVNSKGLFDDGIKFIILDEVDYMTKNAQQALKYLINDYHENVRLCLICNYISKIDESVKNEFITVRFNRVPEKKIFDFIKDISIKENIKLSDKSIYSVIKLYKSDIRSMINFLQANQNNIKDLKILNESVLKKFIDKLTSNDSKKNLKIFNNIAKEYCLNKKNLMLSLFKFLIEKSIIPITSKLLNMMEFVVHNSNNNISYIEYSLFKLKELMTEQ
jgi:DNA polymerase III delta prime subunit